MLNGDGGQITEFVPPSRIFEQRENLSSNQHPLANLPACPPARARTCTCWRLATSIAEVPLRKKKTKQRACSAGAGAYVPEAEVLPPPAVATTCGRYDRPHSVVSSFAQQARSTSIFVLNLSDLKPAVLTAAAALSFVWDMSPYEVNSSTPGVPNRTADEAQALFLDGWVVQQFTGADAPTLKVPATSSSDYLGPTHV